MNKQWKLYPLNDRTYEVELTQPSATVPGAMVPVTTGTVTAIIAASDAIGTAAPNSALSANATYMSGGWWRMDFEASGLTKAMLDALFAATPPFLIVTSQDGVRVVKQLEYLPVRAADTATDFYE